MNACRPSSVTRGPVSRSTMVRAATGATLIPKFGDKRAPIVFISIPTSFPDNVFDPSHSETNDRISINDTEARWQSTFVSSSSRFFPYSRQWRNSIGHFSLELASNSVVSELNPNRVRIVKFELDRMKSD